MRFVFVDMVGPNTIERSVAEDLTLWCVTIIDPAAGWFEIKEGKNKYSFTVATAVEQLLPITNRKIF
jgi:hypothetical protein